MKPKRIAVMGATGHIGTDLTRLLLENGYTVHAIGRDTGRLDGLKSKGAATFQADFTDADRLAEAFAGTDLAFTMIPPNYGADDFGRYQDQCGEATVKALRASGVKNVLDLSSIGAQLPKGTGPIAGLHRQEGRLAALTGLNVVHLRPSYFMQNLMWQIPTIKNAGTLAGALQPTLPIPMIHTKDIAEIAATLVGHWEYKGSSVFECAGPETVTLNDAAKTLGKALGRDLRYVQVAYEDEKKAMLGARMKPSIVDLMIEMEKAFNEGVIAPTQEITKVHEGKIRLADFAKEFARAFKG